MSFSIPVFDPPLLGCSLLCGEIGILSGFYFTGALGVRVFSLCFQRFSVW